MAQVNDFHSISENNRNRLPAWVQVGNTINTQSWEHAAEIGGLDWQVEKLPLERCGEELPGAYGVFRTDRTAGDGFLGSVGRVYTPIQNKQLFTTMDAIIAGDNNCRYINCGYVGEGQKVFAVMQLDQPFDVVEGDTHQTYLVGITSHNGTMKTEYAIVTLRLICTNGMMAMVKKNAFSVKHTTNHTHRLEQASRQLAVAVSTQTTLKERFTELSRRMMTKESMAQILDRLFPHTESQKSKTKAENLMREVLENFEYNDGNAFPEIRGTAYNLLNAYTEWFDHDRKVKTTKGKKGMTDAEKRALNYFDGSKNAKAKALQTIEVLTANNPAHRPVQFAQATTAARAYQPQTVVREIEAETGYGSLLDQIIDESAD